MDTTSGHKFQKLTPKKDTGIEVYCDAINFAFDNDDVKNVALTGAYGSGKSSVLESYKETHGDRKFLHISLAHFKYADGLDIYQKPGNDTKEPDDIIDDVNKDIESATILEGKILNQLIHQIDAGRIPQAKFRRKQEISSVKLMFYSVVFAMSITAILHMIFFDAWSNYVNSFSVQWLRELLMLTTRNGFRLISGIFCALAAIVLFYRIMILQINRRIFKRVGTEKIEAEIFEESDESYFDKYLKEVIYLFDRSDADAIVFEDMDRYNANLVFERLREVNTLVNAQRQKRSNARLLKKLPGQLKVFCTALDKLTKKSR